MTIDTENFIRFMMILIKIQFILHPKEEETGGCKSYRKSGKVDQTKGLILEQVPDSYFKVDWKHMLNCIL